MQSAVEFSTHTRIHIALEASDVGRSAEFYGVLFGQAPTKMRPGYVKFEVADPPVNLSLNAAPERRRTQGVSHFGVQVKSTEAVEEAKRRLAGAGLPVETEENTTCCWAVQDKVWARDPDGNDWEVFVVLDAGAPVHSRSAGESACCAPDSEPLVSIG